MFPLAQGCYYASMWGQAFAWTQLLPSIISLGLTVLTLITFELLFVFLGYYLHGIQLLLWFVQLNLQIDRPNPLCQEYHSYAFPSVEGYYIGAIVAFVLGYSYVWKVRQSWYAWFVLLGLTVVPPTVLVFLAYNEWYEVVISMAIGVLASIIFIIILWVYIYDAIPYIENLFPFHWLKYKDNYIWRSSDAKYKKVERAIKLAMDPEHKRG